MGKIEIRWTAEAEIWLKDIYDYIAQDNLTAAAQVLEGIYETVQIHGDFPKIGHRYRSTAPNFSFTAPSTLAA